MAHSRLLKVVQDAGRNVIGGRYVWEFECDKILDPNTLRFREPALYEVWYLGESPRGHLYLLEIHSLEPEAILASLDAARAIYGDPMELGVNYAEKMADFIDPDRQNSTSNRPETPH